MKTKLSTTPLFATILFVSFVLFFLSIPRAYGQTQSTPIPQTPVITSTAVAVSSQQNDTLEKTYQQVLETSIRAVEEVHQTADTILNWVGGIFIALTLGGFGGAWLLSTFAKRASDKAADAQQKAVEALDVIKRTAKKTTEIEKRNGIALQTANELANKQNSLLVQIESAEKVLINLQTELAQLKSSSDRDRQILKKPLTLVQIDEYGMQLLSGSSVEKDSALSVLLELSTRADAVVRRRTIKTLGILEYYDERVVKRLREIIESDTAEGVRKEARKSLKLIEAKKPNQPMRRKP